MYNHFYGFRENPFNQTPDSSFFFPSAKHKAALDALVYAVTQYKGFVVITGEIGSGKTTVARTMLRKLQGKTRSAYITNTHLTPKGVLTLVLEDLDIQYKDGSKDKLLVQLYDFLLQQAADNRNVVIMIDEAQNLSPACLEEVRMLSNLETEKEKLVQIVLIGQPELKNKLELAQLEQLRQRIAIHYHLSPLSEPETQAYVLHRLNLVKANGRTYESLFSKEAMELIFKNSRGLPRLINHICDLSLLTACLAEANEITPAIVEEAVSDLRFGGKN